MQIKHSTIEEVLEALRQGKPVLVTDAEGNIIAATPKITKKY